MLSNKYLAPNNGLLCTLFHARFHPALHHKVFLKAKLISVVSSGPRWSKCPNADVRLVLHSPLDLGECLPEIPARRTGAQYEPE